MYIYRMILDNNKALNVRPGHTETAKTGPTWYIEPGAHSNILPIAVVYLEPSEELERATEVNYEFLRNKYKGIWEEEK